MPYLEGILTNNDPSVQVVTSAMLLCESGAGPDENNVHRAGTILLAASHVLKFSPTTRLPDDTELSASRRDYAHSHLQCSHVTVYIMSQPTSELIVSQTNLLLDASISQPLSQ
ncbi:hypothetical protein LZ31DRAFT_554859 [Colletotrichum somersetense]|nr:hypothetical protein LZ31DRAFT_554859 [Colletotrichum somersetense]